MKCSHIAKEVRYQPRVPRWRDRTVEAYRMSLFEINEMRDLDSRSDETSLKAHKEAYPINSVMAVRSDPLSTV